MDKVWARPVVDSPGPQELSGQLPEVAAQSLRCYEMFHERVCTLTHMHTYTGASGQISWGKLGLNKTGGSKSTGLLGALALLLHSVVVQEEKARRQHSPGSLPHPRHLGEALSGVGVAEFRAGTSHWVQCFAAQEAAPRVTVRALKLSDKATVQGHTAACGRVHPLGFRSSFLFPHTCPAPCTGELLAF